MVFKESKTVELKQEMTKNLLKEIIAFANTDGGTLYLGVADDGTVVGVENPQQTEESLGNMIRDAIAPDLTTSTDISQIEVSGASVIKVVVQSATHKPYYLRTSGMKPSGVFLRHGTSSVPASVEAIRQLIQEADGLEYDKMRSLNQDLTFSYAEKFFKDQEIPFGEPEFRSMKLLTHQGFYTNAALLLSDQCGHIIKCAVAGDTKNHRFKGREEFSGSILIQMSEALGFLKFSNSLSSKIEGLHRVDTQSYPQEALREALLNAVIHRDYDMGSPVIINVFPQEMEFISVGGLVKGLTLEDVCAGVSHARNEVIAQVFYRLTLVEMFGTGLRAIMKSYEDFPVKPNFIANQKSFIVKLPDKNSPVDGK